MKLILTIGPPGCGKSTFIRPLAEQQQLVYINPDSIREELLGDATDHTAEQRVWRTVYERTAIALRGNGAVIDATNTRRSDRKKFIRLAQQTGVHEIVGYWFTTPLDTCNARTAQRERIVPEEIIRSMYDRLIRTPPTTAEGFTEIHVIDT